MPSGFPGSIDSFTNPLTTSALNSPSHAGQHQDLNDAVNKIETYMGLVKVIPTGATNGTVAANGTVTIGNAVSSVTVSGAFSAQYDSYKILINGGSGTSLQPITLRLGSTATGYYQTVVYFPYTTASGNALAVGVNNSISWTYAGYASTNSLFMNIELLSPFLTEETQIYGIWAEPGTARNGGSSSGFLNDTSSYTAFTIAPASGTLTGGSIRVYGYRN